MKANYSTSIQQTKFYLQTKQTNTKLLNQTPFNQMPSPLHIH